MTGGALSGPARVAFPGPAPPRRSGLAHLEVGVFRADRRAKYYSLTKTGRRQLTEETAQWNQIALAMARALEA